MRFIRALLLAATLGCGHEDPWRAVAPDPLGPPTTAVPRRLTFNTGDDRAPTVWTAGDLIAFGRYDPSASPTPCIAYLPASGGTLAGVHCPPRPSVSDTFVSTWSAPALSPDGRQVAFLWERSAPAGVLGSWTAELVIAPSTSPRTPTRRVPLQHFLAEGFANSFLEAVWTGTGTVRVLAAYDSIWKVKGGGAERFTDSLLVVRRLVDVDPATGSLAPVPGSDSGIAWAPAADGGFWVVRPPGRLFAVSGGVAVWRADFSAPVADLAEVGGFVVAALRDAALVEWIDPASGARGQISTLGPVRRVAAAGGRFFVAEVERGVVLFGASANLWLFAVP